MTTRKIQLPLAFPGNHSGGMTLRDYFAAKAMQGFAADSEATWTDGVSGMAKSAYKWADAMLKERECQT
jgi:hypothetical protein